MAWELASEGIKKTAGLRYHTFTVAPESDDSPDKAARTRVLELLVQVSGVEFIPDASRALLYRRATQQLAAPKDSRYGWAAEVAAARQLAQLGPHVPSIAFEEVYQEILTVWCGNYWGRSAAHAVLQPFIDTLNTTQLRTLVRMFQTNARVQDELWQERPRGRALEVLGEMRRRLTLVSHQEEVDHAVETLQRG